MRINYNVSAMLANNALANNDNALANSLQKLSSGFKINNAKDDPAGLAMAKRINAQIRGLGVAHNNANDGVSVIETADGALSEVASMLNRMTELATKAANGTNSDDDRKIIQDEIAQLKEEITRVSNNTEFNGQPLLDGGYDLKGYTTNSDIKVTTYSGDVEAGKYTFNSLSVNKDAEGEVTVDFDFEFSATSPFPGSKEDYSAKMVDNQITISGPEGFKMQLTVPDYDADLDKGDSRSYGGFVVDATGIGSMRLQVGANEGQVLAVQIPEISLENMGIAKMDVSTEEGARNALDRLTNATAFLNDVRGRLGAYQNRLESTVNSIDVSSESMTSAYSRIMDVDMAEEMTKYSTYTVLTQAGTSVLAQANERPSVALQLLQ